MARTAGRRERGTVKRQCQRATCSRLGPPVNSRLGNLGRRVGGQVQALHLRPRVGSHPRGHCAGCELAGNGLVASDGGIDVKQLHAVRRPWSQPSVPLPPKAGWRLRIFMRMCLCPALSASGQTHVRIGTDTCAEVQRTASASEFKVKRRSSPYPTGANSYKISSALKSLTLVCVGPVTTRSPSGAK